MKGPTDSPLIHHGLLSSRVVAELNPFEWGLPWYYYSVSEHQPLVKEKKWWE